MNLEEAWKDIEGQVHLNKGELAASLKKNSKGEVGKLNRKMRWKIYLTAVLTPGYLALAFFVDNWLPITLFILIFLVHVLGLWYYIRQYQTIKRFSLAEKDVHQALEDYIQILEKTIRTEEKVGLFIYPFAAAAGFFFSLLEKMTLEEAMANTRVQIILAITIVLITPLAHWLAKWMNRKTFGPKLDQLKSRLSNLDDPS